MSASAPAARPSRRRSEHVVEVVGRDPEVDRLAAGGRHERTKTWAVRIRDPGRPELLARRTDLVAGREDGDPRPAVDQDPVHARASDERHRRRGQARSPAGAGPRRPPDRCRPRGRSRRARPVRGRDTRPGPGRSHRGRAGQGGRSASSGVVASTGTTASAPSGSRAPVAMRAAVPGTTVTSGAAPAAMSPMTRSSTGRSSDAVTVSAATIA